MQKMSTEDDEVDDATSQRQSLVSLASSSKGRVPHDRASAARPQQRAILSQNVSQPQKTIQVRLLLSHVYQCCKPIEKM